MKKTEITLYDGKLSYIIKAEEGKKLVCKKTGWTTLSAYLDYVSINGEPILLTPEDFEEIDDNEE